MRARKTLVFGIFAAMLALAFATLSLTGCEQPNGGGSNNIPPVITYTVAQSGGADGAADSTGIVFTFSADPGNLAASEIDVSGNASKGSATVSGSGITRTLSPITVITAGAATVSITKTGVEAAAKSVTVHKAGEPTPYWSITWELNGGTMGGGAYPATVIKGEVLTKPVHNPTKDNSNFGGWHADSGLTQEYDFSSPVMADLTLYAKWEPPAVVPGTTLLAKLQWLASNAASDTYYVLEVTATESLVPQTLSYSGKSNITIQLSSTGGLKSVNLNGTSSLFSIESGVTLILENIILTGTANNNDPLIRVNSGGNLILNQGGKISGNTAAYVYDYYKRYCSGGVFVDGGTFTMNDGEISGNTVTTDSTIDSAIASVGGVYVSGSGSSPGTFTMNGGEISGNTASNGGGVYVAGSIDSPATFTMNGGEISGNTASSGGGGGVVVNYIGTFTMNGGVISGNTAPSGGGVYVGGSNNYCGTFTMNGGEISGNTSGGGGGVYVYFGTFTMNDGEISGNTSGGGGGVYVTGNTTSGTFIMNGGEISGNTANSTSYDSRGGGVHLEFGNFTMTGGEISGNTATTNSTSYNSRGGGVSVYRGTFTMTGGKISGNTASSRYAYGGGVSLELGIFTMTGGEISGNTASGNFGNSGYTYGGGVHVGRVNNSSSGEMFAGTFTKTGGTIYGYSAGDTANSNVVKDSSNTALNDSGNAVYAYTSIIGWTSTTKRKETSAGPEVNLSFDGTERPPTWSGDWDN